MNHLTPWLFVFSLILVACQGGEEVFIRGIASIQENDEILLNECTTNAVYRLGALQSIPQFQFVRGFEELSPGNYLVLDVMGNVWPNEPGVLKDPVVLNFSTGKCEIEEI